MHAVVEFKRKQEAAIVEDRRWKMEDRKNREEEVREQNSRIEEGKLAEVNALASNPCANNLSAKRNRANIVMKMTREKFGSPLTQAMKEFIIHPNEATLKATGKSSIIAMTTAEADEALETAEIFAKMSADEAARGRKYDFNTTKQENLDWSETVTREIVEFAQAVADFKGRNNRSELTS